jgi:hypothetical protein
MNLLKINIQLKKKKIKLQQNNHFKQSESTISINSSKLNI